MSYDDWKRRSPEDEQPVPPPCETNPKYDDEDVCEYCGANPTQGCQWMR